MNSNLISIIKNSLSAAQAALDLVQVEGTEAVMAAPAPLVSAPANEYPPTPFEILINELEDSRYTLRSVNELAEKTRILPHEIATLLRANDIEYVVKSRRSDGAQLIGLASRN